MDNSEEGNQMTLNEFADIIKEESDLVECADAVLGASDHKNCTYLMGYIPRQALYACKTCSDGSNTKEYAGVCLACSLECHDGHELFELYTKRNFRCDCGNKKFPEGFTCKLCPKKIACNDGNSYNQNFQGLYCICNKPYPDPEDHTEDEMIQCIICEDWFHGQHISPKEVESQDYDEMICSLCMKKNSFLWKYAKICKAIFGRKDILDEQIDEEVDVVFEGDIQPRDTDCTLQSTSDVISDVDSCAFFPQNWRRQLCLCLSCKTMYSEKGIEFLIKEGDSIAEYEEKGKANSFKNLYDAEVSKMNHIQKVDFVRGYMDLKISLTDYLKKFAENGKVVREEDIAEFFSELHARKRQRTDLYSDA